MDGRPDLHRVLEVNDMNECSDDGSMMKHKAISRGARNRQLVDSPRRRELAKTAGVLAAKIEEVAKTNKERQLLFSMIQDFLPDNE